ncbi:two-component system, chemotaxis family, response regulator CheB [Marinospirillum celere]|uniref:Protein-glutamate methylesterase/protein-glutamine glutaminase n=1 Tax=Marinospirillum celere TaxID=1122252 RepID=A0A1I1EKW6_9GAMM|nr:chemotaxis-specific protein-glutamate methyltransferase CheB [Marinospirillum celere]SFB87755.1 two-component system, chemotaxis family, response regulator CheB [Marinospirillum celere]
MNKSTTQRVLIADDSAMARALLRAFLEDAGMEVVAEARNGKEAVELVRQYRPDLVTMDLVMPVMDGMEAIEAIMHEKAVPILVVSSQSDAEKACQALDLGALEVIPKPDYTPQEAKDFVSKVRMLAGVPVITRLRRRKVVAPASVSSDYPWKESGDFKARNYQQVFAIASSTGGPQALARILPQLDAAFPAPILIAQHMCDGFVEGMAQWLRTLCPLKVKVAEAGELIKPGCIYVSPSETHLTVTKSHRIALQERVSGEIYRPSCDHLLSSLAEVYGKDAIGLILTGMGRDGAEGMLKIRQLGGIGLAQNEASSVIYGMNQEAVKLGGVHRELPVQDLAAEMHKILELGPDAYLSAITRSSA